MLRSLVLGHYLFLEARSFSQATISDKDYVHGQNIVVYLCARFEGTFLLIIHQIFLLARDWSKHVT